MWLDKYGSIKNLCPPNCTVHYEFRIVSGMLNNYVLKFYRSRLSGRLGLSSLGISGNKSADKSSLQDQDKQQITFFVIRSSVTYSDRLVETTELKVLDFQIPEGFGICPTVLRFCTILVQFVAFRLFSEHLESVFHYPRQQCLLSNII